VSQACVARSACVQCGKTELQRMQAERFLQVLFGDKIK